MSELTYAYFGDIEKSRDEQGFLHFKGVATSDALDLDQQICDLEWLESAMPEWLKSAGNIREMHTTSAVGKASELSQDGSKFSVGGKIVDPVAALKVDEGVYTGLSIGIKGARVDKSASALAKAPGGIINGGKIVEISLVDRPANPEATLQLAKSVNGELVKALDVESDELDGENEELQNDSDTCTTCNTCNGTGVVFHNEDNENEEVPCPDCTDKTSDYERGLFGVADDANTESKGVVAQLLEDAEKFSDTQKRDYSDKEREAMADKGQALPSGGFPIKTKEDVKNAVQAIGRAKNPAEAKAHIKSRAKALGCSDLIPDDWKGLVATLEKAASGDEWMHDPEQLSAIRDGIIGFLKAELDEYAKGDDETSDIYQLASVLTTFCSWWEHEANEGETVQPFNDSGDDMAYVGLGVSADLIKSASAEDATDDVKAELREAIKSALAIPEIDINKAVEAKVTEELSKFESRLLTVEKMAAPRDYSLRATAVQNQTATEADGLEAKAASYRATARLIDNDQTARIDLLKMADKADNEAKELRAKVTTI